MDQWRGPSAIAAPCSLLARAALAACRSIASWICDSQQLVSTMACRKSFLRWYCRAAQHVDGCEPWMGCQDFTSLRTVPVALAHLSRAGGLLGCPCGAQGGRLATSSVALCLRVAISLLRTSLPICSMKVRVIRRLVRFQLRTWRVRDLRSASRAWSSCRCAAFVRSSFSSIFCDLQTSQAGIMQPAMLVREGVR